MSNKARSAFSTHVLRAAAYIAAFFWLALVYVGGVLVSRPETGTHSHLVAWAILLVAGVVMITTMDHWARYLPVIFGSGTLGGLLATGAGHLLNGNPFPRPIAAGMAALFVGCSLVSRPLAKRPLTMIDRVVLVAFLIALIGGMIAGTPISGFAGLSVGFGCLSVAWLCDRLFVRRGKSAGSDR